MSKPRIYGLVGNPIKESLSPLMQNAALSKLNIKAKYKLFPVKEGELVSFFACLNKKNIRGLNITIPYKEKVLKHIKGIRNSAVSSIGATNTVIVDDYGRIKFFNTDYLGFMRHLADLNLKPENIAIIGAGGAARAVCFALGKKKAQSVVVYDVDSFRSLSLIKRFNHIFSSTKFTAVGNIRELYLKNKDLLINASSVGMNPQDPLLIDLSMLHPDLFIYDLIYKPYKTKLLNLAKENGLKFTNGLGMLLYQGAESLNLWLGNKKAPIEVMRGVLEKACLSIDN